MDLLGIFTPTLDFASQQCVRFSYATAIARMPGVVCSKMLLCLYPVYGSQLYAVRV